MSDMTSIRHLFEKSLPLFNALGDPARQQLVTMLIDGERTVTELTAGTDLARPTVSHHLRILKEAGMVGDRKQGRNVYYHMERGSYFDIMRELVSEVDYKIKTKGVS